MWQIKDPFDPKDRKSKETLAWANFKRNVYHKVMGVMLSPLKRPSHHGMAHRCGDDIKRVLFPGILIKGIDGKEACTSCAVRNAHANLPCPKCLVHQRQLHEIDQIFPSRTTESMRAVYEQYLTATTKTAGEAILAQSGLHATKVPFLVPL